ncbi:unnamed protein product, partial [Effrenium voratum]
TMTFFGRTIAWYLIAFAAPPRLPGETEAVAPPWRGPQACEALRERCLARVRLGREALLEKLRGQEGAEKGALRSLVREAVLDAQAPEEWLDEEALLALEEEIYLELRAEAERQAAEEEQQLTERQNAEDAALYEQHLLGGVVCPLCSLGRLRVNAGTLVCSDCE